MFFLKPVDHLPHINGRSLARIEIHPMFFRRQNDVAGKKADGSYIPHLGCEHPQKDFLEMSHFAGVDAGRHRHARIAEVFGQLILNADHSYLSVELNFPMNGNFFPDRFDRLFDNEFLADELYPLEFRFDIIARINFPCTATSNTTSSTFGFYQGADAPLM